MAVPQIASDEIAVTVEETRLSPWRLNNPLVQNLLVSTVLFCNPGLYLTIATLGAGGGRPSSITMANISNAVLYGAFVLSGLFASTVLNRVGIRYTLFLAISGYPIFTGSMWYFDSFGHLWYPTIAGLYLGFTAGLLWTTAAYTSNGYSEEKDRGVWRAIQWTANVAGGTVGGCIALGINWNGPAQSLGVPHSMYIVFICIQVASLGLTFLILPPDHLRRNDGTAIAEYSPMPVWQNIKAMFALFKEPVILIMIPVFFTPEMFFPMEASINAYAFNLRSRTLNTMLGNAIQVPITLGYGYLLDNPTLGTRRRRAFIGIAIVATWVLGAYIAQTIWLNSWKFDRSVPGPSIDIHDDAYPGALIIYLFMVGQYGVFQNTVIYVFGCITNHPEKVARIAGVFIAFISAGTCTTFALDATATPYIHENAALFSLATVSFPILTFVTWKYAKDTQYYQEEGVIVPVHVRSEMANAKETSKSTAVEYELASKVEARHSPR